MAGYMFALISSLFFSLYVIPRKLTKENPFIYSFFMSIGFLLSSVILYCFKPWLHFDELINIKILWSVLAGFTWALGFVTFVKSIDLIGLSRSNQWKNLQGPVGVILSLIILGEYAKTNYLFVILSIIAIFISAIAFTIVNSKNDLKNNNQGVYLACLAAIAFGIVTIINKYVTTSIGVYSQQVVQSFSVFLTFLLIIVFNKKLINSLKIVSVRDIKLGLIAGFLYLGASFFMLMCYKYIPASIGFTIIQLNTVWTISIGLFVFKEINFKKYSWRIIFGYIFAIIGILFLLLARR
jgi:drug/metabolite transporter (DMT)-like permease